MNPKGDHNKISNVFWLKKYFYLKSQNYQTTSVLPQMKLYVMWLYITFAGFQKLLSQVDCWIIISVFRVELSKSNGNA